MPINPALRKDTTESPISRANKLNDPNFENSQGYFPYDLTHQEFITPLFGYATPSCNLDTVPGDRTVIHNNCKTVLNRINGNFLSTVNQYEDTFYVPLRSVFPVNYEKLIPNPTKGDDLPNSALPQVPFSALIMDYLYGTSEITLSWTDPASVPSEPVTVVSNNAGILTGVIDYLRTISDSVSSLSTPEDRMRFGYLSSRLFMLATILSRGQLLDYMGICFDDRAITPRQSDFQTAIDNLFMQFYLNRANFTEGFRLHAPNLTSNFIDLDSDFANRRLDRHDTLEEWRDDLMTALEHGSMPMLWLKRNPRSKRSTELADAIEQFATLVQSIFGNGEILSEDKDTYINSVDTASAPFITGHYLNIAKFLSYQQVIAQYYSNDSIDNIFNSDLYMQNLRAVMYPSVDGIETREPVFRYNGVSTEYDYISCGGFFYSLISDKYVGKNNRQFVYMSLMFLLRRTLRYGDYFSTGRPDMLAVGQLSINVTDGTVSPIDVTKNLLMQRYLNAANYKGSAFLSQFEAFYGVTPSDTGTFPRFIMHRKIELQNQITNNTADEQGKQTTNLVGFSDNNGGDVFIDDFGCIINIVSYDVLPVYNSGIDNTYRFTDRFDYFNPMLQNIGDQPIKSDELLGYPDLHSDIFAYTMRNAEYKYKVSRCHGGFVNDLKGWMLTYPLNAFTDNRLSYDLHISPDFIRDKPVYLDYTIPQITGVSPAQYYHFIVACTNTVQCARKIQATPSVLF